MMRPNECAVPESYRPRVQADHGYWRVAAEFDENKGLATLGLLQKALSTSALLDCTIDLREVKWADPLPLLCLGLILAESGLAKTRLCLDLGSTGITGCSPEHRAFLKFIAQQGFLVALSEFAQLRSDGREVTDAQVLRLRLADDPLSTDFQNADCIFARLLRTDGFARDSTSLHQTVEEVLREAQARSLGSAFGAEPLARDMLFQKLRKLLYELLLNVAEHSHDEFASRVYAGLYARIRGKKPALEENSKKWNSVFRRTLQIFGQRDFTPNPHSEWLELFLCDVGCGLTAHIQRWRAHGDASLEREIRKAARSRNPFESISHRLFRHALSRHPRHDANRTSVTGLQHLGHLLALGSDYCRIYTQGGCWAGGHLPWRANYSRTDIRPSTGAARAFADLQPVSGTCYAFSIQPRHSDISEFEHGWSAPTADVLGAIRGLLRSQTIFAPRVAAEVHDRRIEDDAAPRPQPEWPTEAPQVLILRPPRSTSKTDLAKWLNLVAGNPSEPAARSFSEFLLVDLTPFQTFTFRELFSHVLVHPDTVLDIYLISENWMVSCLTTEAGRPRFRLAPEKATRLGSCTQDGLRVSLAELAVLLRQMDSEIFWRRTGTQAPGDPFFFDHPVDWIASKAPRQTLRLPRYLDFPRAITDPVRYRACRRALRRCLALYPDYRIVPADDLVPTLLRDAAAGLYSSKTASKFNQTLVVGSVAVTAGTAQRSKPSADAELMHVMVHGDVTEGCEDAQLSAILWISALARIDGSDVPQPDAAAQIHPWRRIGSTPYIAPRGDLSISILRYARRRDGRLDFDRPLNGRTPEETYQDFQRLRILKTGHWSYGSRHDLLAVNLRLAFKFSFLELGPLHAWLRKEFEALFEARPGGRLCQLLIYPSHAVTDMMMDNLRQDPSFAQSLPVGGMVPVKFVGTHTISPLFASHLAAYQIEQEVSTRRWTSWSAAVLDDGVVSGKHLRELTQFLQSLGAQSVYTIALIDRTGLPVTEPLMERFNERNRRFWRWDVPTLGHHRDCALCQALAISQAFASNLPTLRQQARIREWLALWRVRDIDTEWHDEVMSPVHFSSPVPLTFGADEDSTGERYEKRLSLSTSTSIASALLELTRLTARADAAFKKARALCAEYPDAAIEIIATQVLIFFDELTSHEKHERFHLLLELLWDRPTVNAATSLAAICFTLADVGTAIRLWGDCRSEMLPKRELGNLDAILAVKLLHSRQYSDDADDYHVPVDAKETEQKNYVMLDNARDVRRTIRDFLGLHRNPTDPTRISIHSSHMRSNLIALERSRQQTPQHREAIIAAVVRDMRALELVLSNLKAQMLCPIAQVEIDDLSHRIAALAAIPRQDVCQEANQWARSALALLYGRSDIRHSGGLIPAVASDLLQYYSDTTILENDLMAKLTRDIRQEWDTIVNGKAATPRFAPYGERWIAGREREFEKPVICAAAYAAVSDLWLFCDSFVQHAMRDLLLNVFYAISPIADPWTTAGTIAFRSPEPNESVADMWWRFEREGDFGVFRFANLCANREISLRQTANLSGLERVGGRVDVVMHNADDGVFVAESRIWVPLHSNFIKGE